MHADIKTMASGEILTSLPSNDVQMASWDTWGEEETGAGAGVQHPATSGGAAHVGVGRAMEGRAMFAGGKKQSPPPDPEPEKDYFQELNLEPAIRRTPKVIVRKKETNNVGGSSRLSMNSDIPIVTGELGMMDELGSGWAEESAEDLSGEAASAMKETRRSERVSKIAEHQLKKSEKDSAPRGGARRGDRLSAVKLS